jgi:NAD+ kinase
MPPVKTVGIISKPGVKQAVTIVPALIAWLEKRGIAVRYDESTAYYLKRTDGLPREVVADGIQLMIVLGGDGTLLSGARAVGPREIPLLAVNLGGLGFLTAVTVEEIFPELDRALLNQQRIARRRMLHCEILRDGAALSCYEALNDMVVTKASIARMIDIETWVDDHFVCAYKADGLIVATPTGSTAYSLSAGGPIIFPSVDALAITPICPHMLTNRPVIVPGESIIRVVNRADDDSAWVTIDGQVGEPLKRMDQIVCRNSANAISLIRPPRMLFFDVLREKLRWGER